MDMLLHTAQPIIPAALAISVHRALTGPSVPSMIRVKTPRATVVPVTRLQQNCSAIWSEQTKEGAVIDPAVTFNHT